MLRLVYPSVLLWLCLPLVLYACISLFSYPTTQQKAILLFIMYIGFSWGIAVLIFVVESARQQLFHKVSSLHSSLRLGAYGVVVVLLALIASPNHADIALPVKIIAFIIVLLYGAITGYIYSRKCMPKQM